MAENQYELEAENVRMRINAVLKEKGLTENSVAAGEYCIMPVLNGTAGYAGVFDFALE